MIAPGAVSTGRFLVGFALIWGTLYASGAAIGGAASYGLVVLGTTLGVAATWERLALGTALRELPGSLGFGRPAGRSLLAGLAISAVMLAFYPVYALASGDDLTLRANWFWLAIGLFAYHGLAEELAWRGYAFKHLRRGRSFRAAIAWTIPLIAATHIPIAITHGPMVGVLAIVVAAVTCLPFGYLWERGRQTIWAAAMLHSAIDAFALFEVPTGDAGVSFSISLALSSLVVPLGVLLLGNRFFGPRERAGVGRVTRRSRLSAELLIH